MSCEHCDKVFFFQARLLLFRQFLFGRRAAEREKQPPEFSPAFLCAFAFPTLSSAWLDFAAAINLQAYNKYFPLCLQFLTA